MDELEAFWQYKTSKLFTSIPCEVVKVHDSLNQQMVDVRPVVDQLYRDNTTEKQPVILSVPVVFPASKNSAFTFPVNVGDVVLAVFSQRGLDRFKAGTGQSVPPTDHRRFSIRDAVAIPGLFPFMNAINNPTKRTLPHSTSDAVMVHNIGTAEEAEVRIKPSGQVKITSKLLVEIDSPTAHFTGNITSDGNIAATGNITTNGNVHADGVIESDTEVLVGAIGLTTHKHSGVQRGGGSTDPSIP